jgi:prepilin-type N-terminal cleavage/methylation domain-containing protein
MKRPRINTPIAHKAQRGFSLIEVIVAITLLSFIMVLVIQTTDSSITTKEKISLEDRDILQAEMAIERMDLDFSQIYSPLYFSPPKAKGLNRGRNYYNQNNAPDEKTFPFKPSKNFPKETKHGYPVPRIDNDRGTLSFLTSSNRRKFEDIKQSHYAWVKYSLRNSTLKTEREELNAIKDLAPYELVRTFIAGDIYNRDFDWKKKKSYLLLRYVKKLKFQFWHSKRKKWVDRLRELPQKDAEVLRAVKITIVWVSKDKVENKVTRVSRPLWPFYDTKNDSNQQK